MPNPIHTVGTRGWVGVDSNVTPSQQSVLNPNGLAVGQLAWLINGTVRDGSIQPRDGWQKKGVIVGPNSLPALLGQTFQGDSPYVPIMGTPYELHVIGGHLIKVDPDFIIPPIDLSEIFELFLPASSPRCYFCQAEQFMVIQGGDYNPITKLGTLPLFWDGMNLTQSNGITGYTLRGTTGPATYAVEAIAAYTVPGNGNTVTIPIAAPYGGNLYDTVTVTGSDTTAVGVYRVTGLSGSTITLLQISSSAGGTQPSGRLIFVLTAFAGGTQTLNVTSMTYPFVVSNSYCPSGPIPPPSTNPNFANEFVTPATAFDFTVVTLAFPYQGPATAATIQIYDTSTSSVLLTCTATPVAGTNNQLTLTGWSMGTGTFFTAYYGLGSRFQYIVTPVWIVPHPYQTVTIPVNGLYAGNIGDTISTSFNGTYTVIGFSATTLTLRGINPATSGTPGNTTLAITQTAIPTQGSSQINQLPAATAMIYYMQRIWYAQGKVVSAGDIVGGPSGTIGYNYTDSVLYVTENPLSLGGDGFAMPSGNDNITGFGIPQMINASLGQGLLNIGTANAVFTLQVPVTRADWIAADSNNQPQILVVQNSNGFVNDWSVTGVNGDLWYQSLTPDIRSILTAVRYFQQWGNVDVSSNENQILDEVIPALLSVASGTYFSNRMWQTTLPKVTPYGTVFQALIPLDFEPISTLETQLPPNWEGQSEGLQIFKLSTATFSSKQRMFATTLSTQVSGQIEYWEMVPGSVGDNGNRINWQASLCSFTWAEKGMELDLKKLVAGELWLDKIQGVVEILVEYSPDGSGCFYKWHKFAVCMATDSSQITPPQGYPLITFQPGKRRPITLPLPPNDNDEQDVRPSNIAFEFQPRITVLGECRVRGFFLKAEKVDRPLYEGLIE